MRGQERTATGRGRTGQGSDEQGRNEQGRNEQGIILPAAPLPKPPALAFSTRDLPPRDRVPYWQDAIGDALIGCRVDALDPDAFDVNFRVAASSAVRLGHLRTAGSASTRDARSLRDGCDDFVFLMQLKGVGQNEHNGVRNVLKPGTGILGDFSKSFSIATSAASAMILRFDRSLLARADLERATGIATDGGSSLMRLLRVYARSAWREALSGGMPAMTERHLAEMVAAVCTGTAEDAARRAAPALGAARVVAMREVIARYHANPCLTMKEVAAAVGLSERAGHLAFERAQLTFTGELYSVRLDRARERLRTASERVLDVAFSVGFSDASHFHRLFRQRFGMTPGDARPRG